MSVKDRLYSRLPIILQNFACSVEGWRIQRGRFGRQFQHLLQKAEERLTWDYEEIETWRNVRLQNFVRHAVTTVPHYRDLFHRLRISPEDIQCPEDLAMLPILTKDEVREAPQRFLSAAVPQNALRSAHTSGTTGGGLVFFTTHHAQCEQWATWWRYFRSHGLQHGTWCGYFGGRSIVPVTAKTPPYWRYNLPGRQIFFSGYHANEVNLHSYAEELRKRRPPWLHGYPSQIALLAGFLVEHSLDLGYRIQWITTGAENLLASQSTLIMQAFGVKPRQHYGMAEAVANMSECQAGHLHVDEDFAPVELIPTGADGVMQLVGTNVSNDATPLLRYAVGDTTSEFLTGCRCGRPGRYVRAVDGRKEDYLVLRNGVRVGRLDHIFKDLTAVREAQIRQSTPGKCEIHIVPGSSYGPLEESRLRQEIATRLGVEFEAKIILADAIPRTQSGKLRFVISECGTLADESLCQ